MRVTNPGLRLGALCALLLSLRVVAAAGAQPAGGLIAPGTRWETPYHVIASDVPGPTVLVTGGLHGNEPAGARAAAQIAAWPILRGKLVVIPRCNVPGLQAGSRGLPDAPAGATDLNRSFPLAGKPGDARGEPAGSIWRFVTELKPQYVLDLHEGQGARAAGSRSVGSSVIHAPPAECARLANVMLAAVNAEIASASNRFVALKGGADGSLARAAYEHLGAHAFICETTRVDRDLSLRVRQHRLMAHALLSALGMVGDTRAVMLGVDARAGARVAAVAVYDGPGAGGPEAWERLLSGEPGMTVAPVHPLDIRDGALGPFDVVLFPGGSGSGQAEGLGDAGRAAVRKFVDAGGGYVGICAGAYLATSHYPWSLGVVRAASLDSRHWRRGNGRVAAELTPAGQALFGREGRPALELEYRQGPILGPDPRDAACGYEVLAWFRSGVGVNGADPNTMVGTPACIRAAFGRGRVVILSPHPEKTKGAETFIAAAIRWCRGETGKQEAQP